MKSKMQMRFLVPVLTAAALSLSGVALAANPPQSGQSSSYQGKMSGDQSGSQAKRLTGTIRSIDTAAGTVTVKGMFLSKTFHADPGVLQGLNVGDKVDVTYSEQGGTFTASQITHSTESSGGSQQQPSSESPSRNPSPAPSTEPSGSSQQPQP